MLYAEEDAAESALVIASSRWVLVVEVKLERGPGTNQPWRENCVGKEITEDRGLSPDAAG